MGGEEAGDKARRDRMYGELLCGRPLRFCDGHRFTHGFTRSSPRIGTRIAEVAGAGRALNRRLIARFIGCCNGPRSP